MPTIPAAVAIIQARPAPVIFLDTCALLDVIRAPYRAAAPTVEAAVELLLGATKNPPTVHLVVGCPTPTEWNENVDEAVAECTSAVACATDVAQTWGFLGVTMPIVSVQTLQLPDRLKQLSQDVLQAAISLDKDSAALSRAVDRIIDSRLPARKGGRGAKDAVILEHAIELTHALRSAAFGESTLFVSSNTRDFAAPGTVALHPLLKADFGPPANLLFAVGLAHAVTILRASGWAP